MQLHERLIDLIGHEVSVTLLEGKSAGIPGGVVKEVGPDFLILGAKDARSDWWVRMDAVATIVHESSCPRCVAGPAA
jgi:ferredoxin-fold anticodon binding domain-containing protein